MGAEYLITGGAGFIGSNLAERLGRGGKSVRVFDNFSTGRRENLHGIKAKIEVIEGDLRNIAEVRKAVAGVRYVLHVAALPVFVSVVHGSASAQLAGQLPGGSHVSPASNTP